MNRLDVLRVIRASVARGSATPTLGGIERNEYIRTQANQLEAALIEPIPAAILGEAHHKGLLEVLASCPSVVVARADDHYLGFIEATGDYFLAYGPDPSSLNALGFFSDDALAEWLG